MSLSGNTEKINELLSKINALPEAGSGGGSGGGAYGDLETGLTLLDSGSFTLTYTASASGYLISHNAGKIPAVILVRTSIYQKGCIISSVAIRCNNKLNAVTFYRTSSGSDAMSTTTAAPSKWTETKINFPAQTFGKQTYRWEVYG